jgi:membrane protease YdiL (CAAX protease family)
LWGALRKVGWKEVWIWLVQAALFTVAHMYYFGNHWISLFVLVPMGGLALGLIVWKSRTISASMPLHGALNSLGTLFASLARFYIFK